MVATVINLSSINGENGFRVDGTKTVLLSGSSVSNAGDVNGDGFDDVIIGAFGFPFDDGEYSAFSYVIFGKASGFDAQIKLSSLNGSNGFQLKGWYSPLIAVSNAGDVNGDGFDDVIVGAHGADPNGFYSGSSYVLFGSASDFDATLDVSSLNGGNGFRLDGEREFHGAGNSVSTAGDVNGDGFDDVIIGATGASPNGLASGSSYVVFGKAAGFDAAINLSSLDGSDGFRLDGEAEGDKAGDSVSNAGDINGDGFDDLIVSAPRANPNGSSSPGSSYIVFGKASGFDATMDLSDLNGSNGFRLDGAANDHLGYSASNAGDVNGDGFDDVIIGATGASPNGLVSGSSYVVFGKAATFDAAINLSSLDGSDGFRLDGAAARDYVGHSVSDAGDVNGDGFDDVIVGAHGADLNGNSSGSSYVVFGKASGFDATVDLASLDSNSGFRLDGEKGFSGYSVSGAGDINGDGFDDLIVGAPSVGYSIGTTGYTVGYSYVIFGRSDFDSGISEIVGTPGDDVLRGTPDADIFEAGDGNDLMIGLGGADIFHGGNGVDQIKVTDLNFALVDGGSGNDILHTAGENLNLDLTDYVDKIQGIETICLYGRGDNMMALTGAELQALSDTSDTLKVHGNAGDRVILEGHWVDEGSRGFYHAYTQDDAVLLVGMNMTAVVA